MVNRVVRFLATLVVVAAVLHLCLPGGVVAVLVAAPFTAAAWSALWSWNVVSVVLLGLVGAEVRHLVHD